MKAFPRTLSLAVFLVVISQSASALVIDLFSGNGTVGGQDSQINYLLGPIDAGFPAAFTPADFTSARSGPAAQIINRNGAWLNPASFNGNTTLGTNAQWISDTQGGASQGSTALYAIDFSNPFTSNLTGMMDFYWSVDNDLGANLNGNAGVYLNGTAVPGAPTGGSFGQNVPATGLNIGSLLMPGTNTLYINARDFGGPGGLMFSTRLTINGTTGNPPPTGVPEPSTLLLMGLGLMGVGWTKRKKV